MSASSGGGGDQDLPVDPAVQRAKELTKEIEELERQSKAAREAGLDETEAAIDRLIVQKMDEVRKLFE